MEKEINIAEILKGYPTGMKLYSPAFGELEFISISVIGNKPIITEDKNGNRWSFYPNGRYSENSDEVMLFPSKDQRDWGKFKKPVVPPFDIRQRDNDTYYFVNDCGNVICKQNYGGYYNCYKQASYYRWQTGNYFNTHEQAEYAAEKVKELLLSLRKEEK